jgi:hypothetical protein
MGQKEITDNYVSIGVFPEGFNISKRRPLVRRNLDESDIESIEDEVNNIDETGTVDVAINETISSINNLQPLIGSEGFIHAINQIIIPQMEKFRPQLLIISG